LFTSAGFAPGAPGASDQASVTFSGRAVSATRIE
jgi:hypothetical protein